MKHLGGYLKPWEASRYLGIAVEDVYKMLQQGELPGLMIDGQWRVPLAKLEQWLDEEVSPKELAKLSKHLQGVDERKIKRFFKEAAQEGSKSARGRAKKKPKRKKKA